MINKKYPKIKDILEWVVEPDKIQDRVDRYRQLGKTHPWVQEIVDFHFNRPHTFTEMLNIADESVLTRLQYYAAVDARKFWQRDFLKYADSNTRMYADSKWGQLTAVFDYMHRDDVDFFWNLMKGTWKGPRRINKVFYSKIK